MEKREFVISSEKIKDVEARAKSIEEMFEVAIAFTSDPSTASRTGNTWLKVVGVSKESTQMAEEYVKSLCNAEHERRVRITKDFHQRLVGNSNKNLEKYERKSGAVIVILSETELLLQGTTTAVKRAVAAVEADQRSATIPESAHIFAKKLGYSDEEILEASLNCRDNVTENALLQELLVSSSKQSLNIESDDGKPGDIVVMREQEPANSSVAHNGTKEEDFKNGSNDLRSIVIDGSNVAMCHGNKTVFSCLGIKICVNWFKSRGHNDVTVFVPQWRKEACNAENPILNQEILLELEREKIVVFTPSRRINGRRVICYDDRYILKLATLTDGVIVSNDNFRDLGKENPAWKQAIDQRLLMYSFVNNMFMPPDDPLGRHGPTLDDFLIKGASSQPKPCPYGKKCTYGQKCRFSHPERQARSSLSAEEDIGRSYSCPSSGNSSPSLPDPQPRRHSYSRPSQYSTCASEINRVANSYPGAYGGDILARGSPISQRNTNHREQFSSRGNHKDLSQSRKNSIQSMPYSPGSQPSDQQEYLSQYVQAVQGNPMLYYPNVYDPRMAQPFMANQQFMPPYQIPAQQFGPGMQHHSPQGYPLHGGHYAELQQRFFPQDGPNCSLPPNLVNRIEIDQHCRSSSDDSKPISPSWVHLLEQLEEIFPNKRDTILRVMKDHPNETDVSVLAQFILVE